MSDDQLEGTRRAATDGANYNASLNNRSPSRNNTLMGRQQTTSKSPLGHTNPNVERKKQLITESVDRLSSPNKKDSAETNQKEDDLIFSIKMSKEEYNQYQKVREDVKKEKPSTLTKKKEAQSSTSKTGRSITPNKPTRNITSNKKR